MKNAEADPDAIDLDVTGAGDYASQRDIEDDDEPAPKKASRYVSSNTRHMCLAATPPLTPPSSQSLAYYVCKSSPIHCSLIKLKGCLFTCLGLTMMPGVK